jgi:predicted metalloprotease
MRWDRDHESPDVIDRRGEEGGGRPQMGGLFYLLPLLMRSKVGWLVIVLAGGYYLISGRLGGNSQRAAHESPVGPGTSAEQPMVAFVSFVLDDTQKTWSEIFRERGKTYQHAKLVLFTDSTSTGCGYGDAATGPFYCPTDSHVYIDLGFYRELSGKLGARGDFAQAYVIAHEIGHHVQNLLGTSERVHQARSSDQKGATGLSVRLELQADCYAGVWGHSTQKRNLLEQGDLDEAITAAQAIGDDRLQRMSRGAVNPEKWTHGSSEQRSRWFRRGYDTGKLENCDTFSAASP